MMGAVTTLALHGLADDRQWNCDPGRQLTLQRKRIRFMERGGGKDHHAASPRGCRDEGPLQGPVIL